MRNFLIIFGAFISFISFSQIEEVKRITKKLCSPEFHGRGYVEGGDSIAAAYLVSEFQKLEVEGYKGSFYQEFGFSVNTFPNEMRIKIGEQDLKPGVHFLVNPASKSISDTLLPFRIDAEIALNPDKLISSIRRVIGSNKYNALGINLAGLSADTLKQLRGISQELGKISSLPIIEIVDSKFMWSVAQSQYDFPFVQIQDSVFQWDTEIMLDIDAKLIENHSTQNVLAFIPAKKKTKETIVFTAHYDHLGRMGKETYFPGANDNASGTAMLFTMAKHFKSNPSDYNILFIAFAGEEAGLIGSKFFVEHPVLNLKKIKFLVNLDIMGSGEEGITAVNATLFEKEFSLLQSINEEKELLAQVKSRGPAQNSDHYWFTKNGVPAFFIYTMGPNKNYHDIFDKYEELSFSEYEDITTLLIEFVSALENQ